MGDRTLPTQDSKGAIGISSDGNSLEYRGAAETGHIEIELPSLPGTPTPVERMHVRDFGPQVAAKIEAAMNRQGYMKSGPQQSGPQTLRHYAAVARGAGLMDEAALGRMEQLASEFAAEAYQQEYFQGVVRPWLHSLKPGRR